MCSTSIYQAFDGQTEFSQVFKFAIFILLAKFAKILHTWKMFSLQQLVIVFVNCRHRTEVFETTEQSTEQRYVCDKHRYIFIFIHQSMVDNVKKIKENK